ncbi:MAG: hypothetical protein JRL30_13750 [Deltaproteobacteria bacterium]|nr:hypothetical protein [Deltaproteobacteria bacterium]
MAKWISKRAIRLTSNDPEDEGMGEFNYYKRRIFLNLGGVNLRSTKTQADLTFACAHELGHAYWSAICDCVWENRSEKQNSFSLFMPVDHSDIMDFKKQRGIHESMANALAISWGFLPDMARGSINATHSEYANRRKKIEMDEANSFNLVVDIIKATRILKRRFSNTF